MGCGFSRRVVPNQTGSESAVVGSGGNGVVSFTGDSVAAGIPADVTKNANAPVTVKDTSLSFIVPIRDQEDYKEGSIIRRHPPVRLRRLEEEQQVHRPKLTLGALERRQAEAEERRRKILDSRVQSAQQFQRKVQPETDKTRSPSPSPSTNWDEDHQEGDRNRAESEPNHGKHLEELPS